MEKIQRSLRYIQDDDSKMVIDGACKEAEAAANEPVDDQ